MRKNCIVIDNGCSFSLDSKTIQTPENIQIADLYNIDISKLEEYELVELTILFSRAYTRGKENAEKKFKKKINNFFDFSIDKD